MCELIKCNWLAIPDPGDCFSTSEDFCTYIGKVVLFWVTSAATGRRLQFDGIVKKHWIMCQVCCLCLSAAIDDGSPCDVIQAEMLTEEVMY